METEAALREKSVDREALTKELGDVVFCALLLARVCEREHGASLPAVAGGAHAPPERGDSTAFLVVSRRAQRAAVGTNAQQRRASAPARQSEKTPPAADACTHARGRTPTRRLW